MVHLIYGYGKGKTTASVGLTLRQAGRGGRILFVQFLKNEASGEIIMLKNLPNVDIMLSKEAKFSWRADENDIRNMKTESKKLMEEAVKKAEGYTMVVFDELLNALAGNIVSEGEIIEAISAIDAEIVLTGIKATPRLIEIADYVTELNAIKHPFEKGVLARKGIEF